MRFQSFYDCSFIFYPGKVCLNLMSSHYLGSLPISWKAPNNLMPLSVVCKPDDFDIYVFELSDYGYNSASTIHAYMFPWPFVSQLITVIPSL